MSILNELITVYYIPLKNIYNIDKLLLGIEKQVTAIVDYNQKIVYSVEDRNQKFVMVIETTCTDDTALRPSFIFTGICHNLG